MKTGKILLFSAAVLIISMAALVWFFPATGAFRIDNPFWNGLSDFSSSTGAIGISSLSDLPANPAGTVLVEIPYALFNGTDLARIGQFVNQGGTLLLMDDYGQGNQVLSYLGVDMRFSGKPLLDPFFNYNNPFLPRIFTFSYPLNGSEFITMNYATALVNASAPNVLAWSSSFSFLDLSGSTQKTLSDPSGPLPVIAYERLGNGALIVVSDPSILINSMRSIDGDSMLVSKLLGFDGEPASIYLDQSHLPVQPLDEAKSALASAYVAVSSPAGALCLIAVAIALSTMPLWKRSQ
jgi:hypothetical protein